MTRVPPRGLAAPAVGSQFTVEFVHRVTGESYASIAQRYSDENALWSAYLRAAKANGRGVIRGWTVAELETVIRDNMSRIARATELAEQST